MAKFDCFKGKCKNCGKEDTLFTIHDDEEGYCEDCINKED